MTKENLINSIVGVTFGVISAFLGGFDLTLRLLCILVVSDYITGIMACIYEKSSISSKVGFKGICKKSVIFILIGVSYNIDLLINAPAFRNMTILFFISNEGISLIENVLRMGVNCPDRLKNIFAVMKDYSNLEELQNHINNKEQNK